MQPVAQNACVCVRVCVCVCVCWKGERLELLGGIEITLQVLTNPTPCSLVMPENEATHSHIPTFPGGRAKCLLPPREGGYM